MAEATVSSPAPRKRRRWFRWLAWALGGLVVLVVVVYFVVTSSAFFKGVILPRASKALNADITVSGASISPFRQVVLNNLKVQTAGSEPLLTAPEVRLRYSLMDILRGNIHIDEATLSAPTIIVVENPDGSRNFDPIVKSQTRAAPQQGKPAPSKPGKPLQIDLSHVTVSGATLRYVKLYRNGNRNVDELSNVNLAVAGLKNSQTAKLTLAAAINIQNNPPPPGTNALLQAKLEGNLDLALTADLKPGSAKGAFRLDVARARGALAQAAALGGNLECDITPTDIKQLALRFTQGGAPLGQVRVSGPFDLQKTEGRLAIELLGIDKQLLNLAGAALGMDFGTTALDSSNQIQLAKSGALITAGGRLNLLKFQVTRTGQTTPTLDAHADYDVTLDRSADTGANLLLRGLTLLATRQGNPLLRSELTKPMNLSLGNNPANSQLQMPDSALRLVLSGLDLADWQPFLGGVAPAGLVNGQVTLVSEKGGKQLSYTLNSTIQNLTVVLGTNRIEQAGVALLLRGSATNGSQLGLDQCKLDVSRQSQPLLAATASGTCGLTDKTADLRVNSQAALAPLLQLMPQPNLSVSSGSLKFTGHVIQTPQAQSLTGSLALADFTGQFASNVFRSFSAKTVLDVALSPQVVQINQVEFDLTPTSRGTNQLVLTGRVDMTDTNATQGNLKLAADSLDLTGYYDLFGGENKAAPANTPAASSAPKPSPATASQPAPGPETATQGKKLPFRNFTVQANIRRLFLREIEIADWQAVTRLDGGHVVVDPLKLTLNGAPLGSKVDVDLAVPGIKYDIAFNAQAVPLAPLVNTFQPERKGILSGTFSAKAVLDGTGTAGPSLRTNLTGQFDLTSTNLNLSVDNIPANTVGGRLLKLIVTTIAVIPDLAKNPASTGVSLVQGSPAWGAPAAAPVPARVQPAAG